MIHFVLMLHDTAPNLSSYTCWFYSKFVFVHTRPFLHEYKALSQYSAPAEPRTGQPSTLCTDPIPPSPPPHPSASIRSNPPSLANLLLLHYKHPTPPSHTPLRQQPTPSPPTPPPSTNTPTARIPSLPTTQTPTPSKTPSPIK